MGLFYTRKGDEGVSHIGKTKVSKTCLEVEVLGQLDELNSMIGVLKSQKVSKELKNILHQIQENLFIIQAQVANIMMGSSFKTPEFKNLKITEAEKIIDEIEKKLKPARGSKLILTAFQAYYLLLPVGRRVAKKKKIPSIYK